MLKLLAALLLICMLTPLALAGDENPTIAILRFGALDSLDITEGGILDVLESYGYITADENRLLAARQDHAGEKLTVLWGEAGFDYPTISVMVADALDAGVDALVTLGTPVTLSAVSVTQDMDAPAVVLFTGVHSPYLAGIADSTCIKPAHVTGSEVLTDYEFVMAALSLQDPDLRMIGAIFNSGESSGVYGVERITALAAGRGITVEKAGVASLADLRAAANGLIGKGVEAIVLPIDSLTTRGLPVIVSAANENGLPVFHPSMGAINLGATVGAGFSRYYANGVNVGKLLSAYLNGDLDPARTGISFETGAGLGVNLDSASAQGVDITDELLENAHIVIQDGSPTRVARELLLARASRGVVIPLEQRIEKDRAWLESLQCTDAMIAEQQAALEAADA